jgi:hypothetical protein
MNPREALIARLREVQNGATDAAFAQRVQVDQGLLSRFYSGERELGVMTLALLQRAFPELAPLIDDYMIWRVTPRQEISVA